MNAQLFNSRRRYRGKGGWRRTLGTLILGAALAAGYPLSLRLISQLHYQRAIHHIQAGRFRSSATLLEKAVRYSPHDSLIWQTLGSAYLGVGVSASIKEAFSFFEKAKTAFRRAFYLSPLNAEAVFGIAEAEVQLARIDPYVRYLYPEDSFFNPRYDPLSYFHQALRLRPNGVRYHIALARYLQGQGNTDACLKVIRNLARIQPGVALSLRKQDLWSPEVVDTVKSGLEQAITEGISVESAHLALSSLMEDQRDWPGAIHHYKKAIRNRNPGPHSKDQFHLGRLYLENGRLEEAENYFLQGLFLTEHLTQSLENLRSLYRRKEYDEAFYRLCNHATKRFPDSRKIRILLARSLVDLKRYDQARRILEALNQKAPTAESYYWLSRIAQEEKDWDAMELAIQKATVLEPQNSHYHFVFSQILTRMKKLDRADKEASLSIRHSDKTSGRLFNHRAWIRWAMEDYGGAAADWESAISLEPANAVFHARAAEAYKKLGEGSRALDRYRKAVQLDPANKAYRKQYDAILSESKTDQIHPLTTRTIPATH